MHHCGFFFSASGQIGLMLAIRHDDKNITKSMFDLLSERDQKDGREQHMVWGQRLSEHYLFVQTNLQTYGAPIAITSGPMSTQTIQKKWRQLERVSSTVCQHTTNHSCSCKLFLWATESETLIKLIWLFFCIQIGSIRTKEIDDSEMST